MTERVGRAAILSVAAAAAVLVVGAAFAAKPAARLAPVKAPVVVKPYTVTMRILTNQLDHRNGPEMQPAHFTFPAHATVHMIIVSYDDGPAPVPPIYARVRGDLRGTFKVDGKKWTGVPAKDVSHTFTVPGLGLNVPVPAAPHGGKVVVTVAFRTGAPGNYLWQCYAPCGDGDGGWGYPMTTDGMMRGTVRVA